MVQWGPGDAPSTLLVSECPSLRTLQEFTGDTNRKVAGSHAPGVPAAFSVKGTCLQRGDISSP